MKIIRTVLTLSQYGSIRVYEFGPEDGEKVFFVHGISTPCITLAPIALALSKGGYRVMLFVCLEPLTLLSSADMS